MNGFFNTIRSYLLEYLPRQKCCSEHTIKAHRNTLNLFISYLRNEQRMHVKNVNFSIIDRQLVVDFLNWLTDKRGCSLSTRNQRLSVLRTFFEYAGQLDCTQIALEINIKKIPSANHPKPIVDFLSENALKALLSQPNIAKLNGIRDRVFMSMLYDTAARCSELLDMKISDLRLNISKPIAYLRGKGAKIRVVPVMPKTAEHCKQYLRIFHPKAEPKSNEFLFYTTIHDNRHKMSPDAVAKFMMKYGEKAREICPEVPDRVHPHQLRHTRAIHLYRDGMPLVLVGEYLGHVNPETTKIYAYADAEMKRKAIEKADAKRSVVSDVVPIWSDDEDMILKLSGL